MNNPDWNEPTNINSIKDCWLIWRDKLDDPKLINLIDATIAALSPVLPDEVQQVTAVWREHGFYAEAALIERQAREIEWWRNSCKDAYPYIEELQQRIKELESQKTLTSDNVAFVCTQQDFIDLMNENQKQAQRIKELGIMLGRSGDRAAELQQRIDELTDGNIAS